jgi:hypothetical protein
MISVFNPWVQGELQHMSVALFIYLFILKILTYLASQKNNLSRNLKIYILKLFNIFTNNSIKCPACQGNVGWVPALVGRNCWFQFWLVRTKLELFKIPFVSWHTTKVEIVTYRLLKSGTSTLIILCTFTHFKPMVPCPCRTHTVQGPRTRDTRVEWLVSEHLSAQGRLDPNNWCPITT